MADRTRLGSLQFHAETAAEFGNTSVAHAPDAGEFLRAWATEKELKEEPIEEEFYRSTLYKLTKLAGTKRNSRFKFKLNMADQALTSATATFAMGLLLESAWGGRSTVTTGRAPVTVNSADRGEVIVAAALGPLAGDGVVVKDTVNGIKEMRWIKSVATGGGNTTCQLNQDLSFIPLLADADVCYFGHTIYPADTVPDDKSQWFKWIREGTNNSWEMHGCRADGVVLKPGGDGLIDVEFDWRVTDWTRGTGESMVADVWAYARSIPYLHHAFYIDGTKVAITADWQFELGHVLEDLETPEGQGRSEFEYGDREVMFNFSPLYSSTHFDRFPSTTMDLMMVGQEGAGAGNQHWGLHIPAAHYIETPADKEEAQQNRLEIKVRAGTYSGDTGAAPANTDARISIITSD